MTTKKQVHRLEDLLVEEVSLVDKPANKRPFVLVKSASGAEVVDDGNGNLTAGDPPAPEPVDKAVWSTAFVNDLPDSSFLYIAPGGKKDADGKTTPRTLRMFPVRDASGKPDPAHVRNAIARIPQANIDAGLKAKLQAAARKLLDSLNAGGAPAGGPPAAKSKAKKAEDLLVLAPETATQIEAQVEKTVAVIEKGLGMAPEVRRGIFQGLGDACRRLNAVMNLADAAPTDYEGVDPSSLAPLFSKELADVSTVIAGVAKMLGAVSKSDTDPALEGGDAEKAMADLVAGLEAKIEKRGAKMSSARLSKFKEALGLLHKLMDELDTVTANDPGKGRTAKDEDGAIVQKALEGATTAIERLSQTVKKQAREIHGLKQARPAGNAIPVESTPVKKGQDEEVRWPRDMNAPSPRI